MATSAPVRAGAAEGHGVHPVNGMSTACALLDPTEVQGGRSEVHLFPAKVGQFGSPKLAASCPGGPRACAHSSDGEASAAGVVSSGPCYHARRGRRVSILLSKLHHFGGGPNWLKAQQQIKESGPEVQKISFHCAKDGTEFSVLFARESSKDKFRIRSIEPPQVNTDQQHKQTFLEWAEFRVSSNVSDKSKSFDAKEFDMAGWRCACCQHSSWPQYLQCSKCNRLVCGSKVISIQNGPKTFQCAPDCDGGGVIEGQISAYSAERRETEKAKTFHSRHAPNSELASPDRAMSEQLHSGGKPLNLSQPSQLQDKPAIAI